MFSKRSEAENKWTKTHVKRIRRFTTNQIPFISRFFFSFWQRQIRFDLFEKIFFEKNVRFLNISLNVQLPVVFLFSVRSSIWDFNGSIDTIKIMELLMTTRKHSTFRNCFVHRFDNRNLSTVVCWKTHKRSYELIRSPYCNVGIWNGNEHSYGTR